jgi:hypothetical protein
MGVKAGARALLVNAPDAVVEGMGLPELEIGDGLLGEFDYIHLFTITRAGMDEAFPRLKAHLKRSGTLWVSWPKGRRLGSDLGLPAVIEVGYNHGLVESTCLRVDDTWAGLKFTYPKVGRVYNNSYGTLPDNGPSAPPEARSPIDGSSR